LVNFLPSVKRAFEKKTTALIPVHCWKKLSILPINRALFVM